MTSDLLKSKSKQLLNFRDRTLSRNCDVSQAWKFLARYYNIFLQTSKKKDKTPIPWTEESFDAFEKCKQRLQRAVTLAFPSTDAKMVLMTDCSNTCTGTVLQQKESNSWKSLGFFTQKPFHTQRNYSTYDSDLLAILLYMAIKYFRYLMEGRSLMIYIDHKSTVYAMRKGTMSKNYTNTHTHIR